MKAKRQKRMTRVERLSVDRAAAFMGVMYANERGDCRGEAESRRILAGLGVSLRIDNPSGSN